MTPFLNDFKPGSIKQLNNISVRVGDGHQLHVHQSGTNELLFQHTLSPDQTTKMIIHDVLYVPEISHRLASAKILNVNGYSVLFNSIGPNSHISLKSFQDLLSYLNNTFQNNQCTWPSSCKSI